MEDLIAQFPNEFFSGHSFILKGRQQSFAEVGRFDLLFVDSFQTSVLMGSSSQGLYVRLKTERSLVARQLHRGNQVHELLKTILCACQPRC